MIKIRLLSHLLKLINNSLTLPFKFPIHPHDQYKAHFTQKIYQSHLYQVTSLRTPTQNLHCPSTLLKTQKVVKNRSNFQKDQIRKEISALNIKGQA